MWTLQINDYPKAKRKDYILREEKTGFTKIFKLSYRALKNLTAEDWYKFDSRIREIARKEFEKRKRV